MRPELKRAVEALWYPQSAASRVAALLLAVILLPAVLAYAVIAWCRRSLYRLGWLRRQRLAVPVIVVGNITAGGTGKTPVVAWLAGLCRAMGRKPGIVSRGYGGAARDSPRLVRPTDAARDVGDEPLLLCRQTGVPVCVCADRVLAGQRLMAEGVDIVIADDGLQHHRLWRDLEVAVIDGARRFGNGLLLPAGPLREPVARLRSVDLVLVNGSKARENEHAFATRIPTLQSLDGTATRPLAAFRGQAVRTVAGIGNPARFHAQLAAAGILVQAVPVPDHGTVDLRALVRASDMPVVMTAKDAVKYPADMIDGTGGCAVWVAQLEVDMPPAVQARVRELLGRLGTEPPTMAGVSAG